MNAYERHVIHTAPPGETPTSPPTHRHRAQLPHGRLCPRTEKQARRDFSCRASYTEETSHAHTAL